MTGMTARTSSAAVHQHSRTRVPLALRLLGRQERFVLVGSALLAISLFLPWYVTEPGNPASLVNGLAGELSAWETHDIIRWGFVFVLAHAAALLWNTVRRHQVPWLPGEPTMVQAVNGFGLLAYVGFIDRPGEPMQTISLGYGWWLALAGLVLMIVGPAMHAHGHKAKRRPPGVLK